MLSLYHFLVLSALLFSIGVYGVLTRRNILGILMSIEIMFNAANINLLAFNHYLHPANLKGNGFALFIITISAAESVVGLSLVMAIYRTTKSIYTDKINILHG